LEALFQYLLGNSLYFLMIDFIPSLSAMDEKTHSKIFFHPHIF